MPFNYYYVLPGGTAARRRTASGAPRSAGISKAGTPFVAPAACTGYVRRHEASPSARDFGRLVRVGNGRKKDINNSNNTDKRCNIIHTAVCTRTTEGPGERDRHRHREREVDEERQRQKGREGEMKRERRKSRETGRNTWNNCTEIIIQCCTHYES